MQICYNTLKKGILFQKSYPFHKLCFFWVFFPQDKLSIHTPSLMGLFLYRQFSNRDILASRMSPHFFTFGQLQQKFIENHLEYGYKTLKGYILKMLVLSSLNSCTNGTYPSVFQGLILLCVDTQ